MDCSYADGEIIDGKHHQVYGDPARAWPGELDILSMYSAEYILRFIKSFWIRNIIDFQVKYLNIFFAIMFLAFAALPQVNDPDPIL